MQTRPTNSSDVSGLDLMIYFATVSNTGLIGGDEEALMNVCTGRLRTQGQQLSTCQLTAQASALLQKAMAVS